MKTNTIIGLFGMMLCLPNCKDSTQPNNKDPSIYGTWQLVESFSHPPTGNGWTEVKRGFILNIAEDGTFTSSEFPACTTGTFQHHRDTLTFKYDCKDFTAGYETPKGTFSYRYTFANAKLELTPTSFTCFEGCTRRLSKDSKQ